MAARQDLCKRHPGGHRTRAAVPTAAGGPAALKDRALAERLASADQLRPGCSLKEAEDVIGALTSFDVFDRLHQDGRRSSSAVADILMRLAGAILNPAS